jgi:hypothetical protein
MEIGPLNRSGGPQLVPPENKPTTRQRVAEMADRELANEKAGGNAQSAGTALHAERIDDIRRKIESGYYDRPDVKKMIAERLSGDLGDK